MAKAARSQSPQKPGREAKGAGGASPIGRETAQRILLSTGRLLGERGYAGTSISAICQEAQVTATSVYHLFGSKEGLFRAVIEDVAARWIAAQQRLYETAKGTTADSSHALVESRLEIVRREMLAEPVVFRILYMQALERGHADPETLALLRRVRALFVSDWEAILRDLLAPGRMLLGRKDGARLMATFILAAADGIFLHSQVEDDHAAVDRLIDLLRSIVLLAVEARGQPA